MPILGLPEDISKYFGYFTHPDQTEPAYDPGLEVGCPFCPDPLTPESAITTSLQGTPKSAASFFYRVHRECMERVGPEGETDFEKPLRETLAFKAKRMG